MSGSKPFYSSYPNDIVKFSISHTHDGKVGTELEVKTCPACGSLEHPLWGEKTCNLKGVTEAKLFPGSNCSVCSFKIEPGQMMARVNLGWAHRDCALQVMHPTGGGTPPSDADIAKVSVSQEMKVGLKSVLQDPGNKLWEKPAGCLKTTALVAIKSLVGEVHTSAVCFNKLAAQNLRDRGVMKASTFDAKAVQALATTYRHRLACFKALPNGDGPLLSNDASVHNSSLPIDNLNVKYKAMLNVLYPANLAPLAHGEKLSDRFSVEYISLQDVVTRGMTLAFNRGYGRTPSSTISAATQPSTMPFEGILVLAAWISASNGPSQTKQCARFGDRAMVMNHIRRFWAPSPIQHLERRAKMSHCGSAGFRLRASRVDRHCATPCSIWLASMWFIRQSRDLGAVSSRFAFICLCELGADSPPLASLASVSGAGGADGCFRLAALSLTSSPLVNRTAHRPASSLNAVRTQCSALRSGRPLRPCTHATSPLVKAPRGLS